MRGVGKDICYPNVARAGVCILHRLCFGFTVVPKLRRGGFAPRWLQIREDVA